MSIVPGGDTMRTGRAILWGLVMLMASSVSGLAQVPPLPTAPPPEAPAGATAPPAIANSDLALPSFIKSLSANDSAFEVILGQGRLLTLTKDLTVEGKPSPVVATGDPTVIDFDVVGPRHLRVTGLRIGATDLSVVTADRESLSIEVRVVPDLDMLRARVRASFPDAQVELAAMRHHVVIEGQARDARQVAQIVDMIDAYLESIQPPRISGSGGTGPQATNRPGEDPFSEGRQSDVVEEPIEGAPLLYDVLPEASRGISRTGQEMRGRVINLLRVPGPQQVLLKVQVAELNRTALRQIGLSFLVQNGSNAIGSAVGPGFPIIEDAGTGLLGLPNPALGPTSTAFGVLDGGNASLFVNALRRNQVLTILAEPNLVAMHGQEADFLAGGEFPVPVPQPSGGTVGLVTIQYRTFGVSLTFVPYILDGDTIRLSVAPEVSAIDFSAGVTIQGTAVPGLTTRRTKTVVELREGQTLAISGILQVQMDGSTSRIPGLGDLPHIGALFRNNTSQTVEKELVVMVTPYLVQPMCPDEVPLLPGADVHEPDDCEFYLKGRIENRDCRPYRATTAWDDPLDVEHEEAVDRRLISGPYGYSE